MTHTPGPTCRHCGEKLVFAKTVCPSPTWCRMRLVNQRDEAREHRRRLFEALERCTYGSDDEVGIAIAEAGPLLDELRPHVAKEGA